MKYNIITNIEEMTLKEAKAIKDLRVTKGLSWRAVATEAFSLNILGHREALNSLWKDLPCNQLAGIDLCRKAAILLDGDYFDGEWN